MVEPAHLEHGHGESAVEEEADLVPVGHGERGVQRGLVDQVDGVVDLRHQRLPARAVGQRVARNI